MRNETGSAMSFGHWATGWATSPLRHFATWPLSQGHSATEEGNAMIEYVVLALIVMLATIGFYTSQLKTQGAGARGAVESAFSSLCNKIAGAECEAVVGTPQVSD